MISRQWKITRYEVNAAECDVLADFAADKFKRVLYQRVAAHFREFANNLRKEVPLGCDDMSISCNQFPELESNYDAEAFPQSVFVRSAGGNVVVAVPRGIRSRS